MPYNPKYKDTYLRYQAKLREQGLYNKSRNTQESYQKMCRIQYEQNALLCIKKLFGNCHLI